MRFGVYFRIQKARKAKWKSILAKSIFAERIKKQFTGTLGRHLCGKGGDYEGIRYPTRLMARN